MLERRKLEQRERGAGGLLQRIDADSGTQEQQQRDESAQRHRSAPNSLLEIEADNGQNNKFGLVSL